MAWTLFAWLSVVFAVVAVAFCVFGYYWSRWAINNGLDEASAYIGRLMYVALGFTSALIGFVFAVVGAV